jgi:hypothetical protein
MLVLCGSSLGTMLGEGIREISIFRSLEQDDCTILTESVV